MKTSLVWRLSGAALALWMSAGAAGAQEKFQQALTPAGLPFWHLQRAEEPRALIVGSFADAFALNHPDKIAAAVVGATMIDYGPKGIKAGDYNEQLKDYQAGCNVSSEPMLSTFSAEARAEDFGAALDLCLQPLMDPALRERDFERLRKSSVVNRARLESNRSALASFLMRRLTWGSAPFSRWSEPEEIAKIDADGVELWKREVFARDNVTIVAIGPLDAATFGKLIDHSFGRLPEHAIAAKGEVPSPVYPGKTIVFESAGDQTVLVMEGALSIESPESQAANIGNNVLGGGLDRRLGKAVRGEQGATYGISSSIGAVAPGKRIFSIRSALANDLAPAAIQRVREVTESWRNEGVSEREAALSRSLLATSFERGLERIGSKASALLSMLRAGRTAEDEALYADRMRATPTEEVNRVLRERMPQTMTTLLVAPKADGLGADCVVRNIKDIETCR